MNRSPSTKGLRNVNLNQVSTGRLFGSLKHACSLGVLNTLANGQSEDNNMVGGQGVDMS